MLRHFADASVLQCYCTHCSEHDENCITTRFHVSVRAAIAASPKMYHATSSWVCEHEKGTGDAEFMIGAAAAKHTPSGRFCDAVCVAAPNCEKRENSKNTFKKKSP